MFLGIRTWPEAGKIISIEKAIHKGTPCIAVKIANRIGKFLDGMEDFSFNNLPINIHDQKNIESELSPSPRGSIFSTVKPTNKNSIYLSSIDDISFKDTTINSYIKKQGLAKNPIVLYSQNKHKANFNVFGSLNTNKNIDFSIFPFQPYITLLRHDQINQTESRFFSCIVYSNANETTPKYKPESFFTIKPFDVLSKKFKGYQDLDYINSFTTYGIPDIVSWNDNGKYLSNFNSFLYKGPRGFTDAPIYEDGKPYLTYLESGILYSQHEDSQYVLKYNDFFGNPYYYGDKEKADRVSRLGFFDTLDNISHNIGDISTSPDNIQNDQQRLLNLNIFGNNNSSISNIINKTTLRSKFLSNIDLYTITPVNVENRYIAYSIDNTIFLWDQYNNMDLGPYKISKISGNINNLIGVRDFIINLNSQYFQIDSERKKISWTPLSPKYFGNIDLFVNLNYNYSKSFWNICTSRLGKKSIDGSQGFKEEKTISFNTSIPSKLDDINNTSNLILTSLYENSIFFSNSNMFGFYNVNKNSYVYLLDKESGNILENNYGTYKYKTDISISYQDKDYLPITLNNDNEKQNITIMGERNGIGFLNSSNIVLSDTVIPAINFNSAKIFTHKNDELNNFDVYFKTNQWIPDKVSICGTQLDTLDDYKNYFNNEPFNPNINLTNIGTENIIKINTNLKRFWGNKNKDIISGNHIITLGLENWPTGSSINGKRCNYEQVNLETLLSNFSTSIIIVNNDDIKIENQVEDNGYITTLIKIKNAFLGEMPTNKLNYLYNSSENTLEIQTINLTTTQKPFLNSLNTSILNRLDNCTLILEDTEIGKKDIYKIIKTFENSFKISLPPVIAFNPDFYINQLIDSFLGKKFAVAAFVPNQIFYFDNRTSFSSDRIHLSIKEFSNNTIIYETTNYVANDNLININLYEKYRDDYIQEVIYSDKIKINSINNDSSILNDSISSIPQINIALYRNYDSENKIFTNDFIEDKFNRFNTKYNLIQYTNKFYVKITSNIDIDMDKTIKFVIRNLKNQLNPNEKIIYNNNNIEALSEHNIEHKRGSKSFLVEVQPSVSPSENDSISLNSFLNNDFSEIEFAFEGYDIKGTKIQYGNLALLNN